MSSKPPYQSKANRTKRSTWSLPEKVGIDELTDKWTDLWEKREVYRFNEDVERDEVFSIDTPPPTVSGRLHIGHACSYTQTDVIARYKRMAGKEVYYPMGWDNNGLNVERRAQIEYGIICDPDLPYDPNFQLPSPKSKKPIAISRKNFIEQCERLTEGLQAQYQQLWTRLGLSVDWSKTYTTMSPASRRSSQLAFIRMAKRGNAYQNKAPTLWDVDMKTAVAQAELEDREIPGAYHKLLFKGVDGAPDFEIDTTRPELLASCVALVVNPEDDRYKEHIGKKVQTALFHVEVPIVAHELADPEKGTGAAMICTFGDVTDVIWWRELKLDVRTTVMPDGRIANEPPHGIDDDDRWRNISGKKLSVARESIVEMLKNTGEMIGEPRKISHPVKFWENGTKPLEIITNDQWFFKIPPKETMLSLGAEINWTPSFMKQRYDDWTNGLLGDWNVTRQRFFSVPIPVWYKADDEGVADRGQPIYPSEDSLPVDPLADAPSGYNESQRNQPHGFVGDKDVLDTWATSSLTPQLVCDWERNDDRYNKLFPMDMRPQAHEIIRTWLFYTIVRTHYISEHQPMPQIPWKNAAISGFVVDPDRKKLSKSKGNSKDDPEFLEQRFGPDGIRYWAASGKLGYDVIADEGQMKVGRRLATKLLNASKFVLGLPGEDENSESIKQTPLDESQASSLSNCINRATELFDEFDYAGALNVIEESFWSFCDDYIELVKVRAYGEGEQAVSARRTLRDCIEAYQLLLAPFVSFAAEEAWSWWHEGSVHRAAWPMPASQSKTTLHLGVAAKTLGEIRKAKSAASVSMKADVELLEIFLSPEAGEIWADVESDIADAGRVQKTSVSIGTSIESKGESVGNGVISAKVIL